MPNAMLLATPPRRTTRSSTRNERETLCSWSAMNCSANRPGKCIRWSVAIEPVTAIFMAALEVGNGGLRAEPTGRRRTTGRPVGRDGLRSDGMSRYSGSVEGVAARAGVLRVRVVDREALRVDPVGEVDRGAGQVRAAHPVDDDLDTAEVAHDVAVERALVEEQLVAQAGAATRLYGDTQAQVVASLLLDQGLDLLRGDVGQDDAGRSGRLG